MTTRYLLALTLALAAPATVAKGEPFEEEPLKAEPLEVESIFDTSRLLDVRIEIPEEDWRALRSQSRDFGVALGRELPTRPFTYFKGNVVIDGVRIDEVGIRKKGFLGSLDEERPSLKIKFSEYEEKRPIAGVDRLTLNNNKQDDSLTYQFLAYQLFAKAGAPAPRCNLARVTVNGTDLGIYSNVESIKKPFLKRHFGDDSGRLYEGTLADLFVDRLDRFEAKGSTGEETRESLKRVAEILYAEGDLAVDKLERVVDIDAFLSYWAVESLISFWDGYTNNQNNFFVYENPGNSKLYWIPWGVDAVFSAPPPLPFLPRGPPSVQAHSVLANRLYHDEEMRERYRKTLLGVLETVWQEEKLLSEIDNLQKLVGDHRHKRQQGYKIRLGGARWFIKQRRSVIMADLEQWPVEVVSKPRVPMHTKEVGSASGSFSTTWRKKSPKDPYGTGQAKLELVLHGQVVKFKQLGVSAEPGQPMPGEPGGTARRPAIVFTGERESDGKKLTIAFVTSRDLFRPDSSTPVPVQGMLLQGSGIFAIGSFRFLSGTATFDKAERKSGAPVEGRVKLKVLHMRMR